MKKIPICILTGILLLGGLQACNLQGKSDLVKRLEAIFYDPSFAGIPDRHFSAADYGAVGDGKTLNTRAIQKAIDAASEAGGGVVSFPPGTYLSGALFIKSNVELHLDEGVTVQAIQADSAFPDVWTRIAGIEMYWPAALINIYEQKNVRITGKGTIDGNGKYWWTKFWGDPPLSGGMWSRYSKMGVRWALDYDCKRVRAVVAYKSENVLMKDFTVLRSGFWTVTMTYCSRVHVDGIVIRNNIGGFGPSSDGIDTDSSGDILVENCDIDCNDDNLCIKSGRDADGLRVNRPSENIVYRNSITRAGHGLFTIGSETSGGMRNIEVYGLRAVGTNMGIRFKSAKVRGGEIRDIWFHNIEMDSVRYPFHFELYWYPQYSYPVIPESFPKDSIPEHWKVMTQPVIPPERGIPEFHDITISDVTVKHAGTAFYANAYPEKPIHDVTWKNVSISADKAGSISHARDWTMENVSLEVEDGGKIRMEDCENVGQPEYSSGPEPDEGSGTAGPRFSELLESMGSWGTAGRISVGAGDGRIIHKGDTLYSDTIRVIFTGVEETEFGFSEPLGDGYYISPVNIRTGEQGGRLSVSSERVHHWILYASREKKPGGVSGAGDWQYDPDRHRLVIRKTGSAFELEIR